MSKNKDRIRVSFPSASAESVAGSQVLITYYNKDQEKQQILVECGLIQGLGTALKEYQANSKKFEFKPKELNYVFCCHLHSDHIGNIPRLYKEGCQAKLIAPTGSRTIIKEMLLDSAKIMDRDVQLINKKLKKEYSPIYDDINVFQAMEHFEEYERHERIQLDDNVTFKYINSGHIINSCQLVLWIKQKNTTKKIIITSDLGNRSIPQYYVDEFEYEDNANLIIGETTYCNKKRAVNKKDRDKDLEKIEAAIYSICIDRQGSILIPAFSLQRFQVLLTHLYDLFYNKEQQHGYELPQIYAASPLACKISELFLSELRDEGQAKQWERVYNWDKINFIKDFSELEARIKENKPTIYIASAGMLNAGYSTYIASQLLPKAKNMILFCGFMAESTLGAKIKSKKTKSVMIDGAEIPARCDIMALNSFTSHMQHDDLLWLYSSANYEKIALVHGEMEDKLEFQKELQNEISKKNKTGRVICVNKSTEITL